MASGKSEDPLEFDDPKGLLTKGATVTGCAPVVSFCCKGLY